MHPPGACLHTKSTVLGRSYQLSDCPAAAAAAAPAAAVAALPTQ